MAAEAKAKGLDVRCCFFHARTAQEIRAEDGLYDLVIGNNVLAHVPDINSFVEGLSLVLGSKGTITMEFPHLLRLIQNNQFDTIYHEHFHYLSLETVKRLFHRHRLKIYDVEELPTHGGSLRIYAAHEDCTSIQERDSVSALLNQERDFGLENIQTYTNFPRQMQAIQRDALQLFSGLKKQGKRIAAFGAAAKGIPF